MYTRTHIRTSYVSPQALARATHVSARHEKHKQTGKQLHHEARLCRVA